MGAALSYYRVFSLAPLLLIVISIAGLVFGAGAARGEIFDQLRGADGRRGAEGDRGDARKREQAGRRRRSATVIGVGRAADRRHHGVRRAAGRARPHLARAGARPRGGLWGLLRARLLSFGMILGIAFLLMVSLVLSAALSALGKWWGGAFGGWELLLQAVNLVRRLRR